MTVAATILAQLGSNKFIAMTGAKNFVRGENYLMFSIGKNKSKANKVKITLQANDTYTVEFFRMRGIDCNLISKHSDIYAETLAKFVGSVFGMQVSL